MQAKKVVPRKVLPDLLEPERWSAPSSEACCGGFGGLEWGPGIRLFLAN